MASKEAKHVVFALNGHKIELSNFDPATRLLDYLRYQTPYKGAKLGCGEGGCGACVVLLSKYNPETKKTDEFSISSCLTLLASVEGCSITTTEGLGNCKDGYHSIHERVAGFHASQCGYCTPGMCMSIYGALRQAEKANNNLGDANFSVSKAEEAIAGNLCRCTGYRPLVDVCKSFAGDVDLEDLGLNSFWKRNEVPDPKKLPSYDPTTVSTFPQFLKDELEARKHTNPDCCIQNGQELSAPTLSFTYEEGFAKGEKRLWIRPSNLKGVLDTLESVKPYKNGNEVKLVVGNTCAGVYKQIKPRVFVDISNIPELQVIRRLGSAIEVGAAVTIAKLIEILEDQKPITPSASDPEKVINDGNLVFKGIASHLNKVASGFIRNTASIGGNLIMAQQLSFDSDVATILLGAGASVKIISTDRIQSVLTMEDFLDTPSLDSVPLLLSVSIPSWNQSSYSVEEVDGNGSIRSEGKLLFKTYRAAPRPLGNAVAYVNAAFLAEVSSIKLQRNQVIKSIRLSFGAFGAKHAIRTKSVEEFLIGKVITSAILLEAVQMLKTCVVPVEGIPKAAYRQSVAVGFLFDFLSPLVEEIAVPSSFFQTDVMDEMRMPLNFNDSLSNDLNSVTLSTSKQRKNITAGKQIMELHNDYYPVGQPLSKIAAELQASGNFQSFCILYYRYELSTTLESNWECKKM
eukprot:Gb_10656 [translate_table: standard]